MMTVKRKAYRNRAILDAANGERCTVESPDCNHNTETTVFAHFNESYAGKGAGQKADDCAGVFACSDCHDWLDYRANGTAHEQEKEWYWRRAYYRTIRRLIEKGVL